MMMGSVPKRTVSFANSGYYYNSGYKACGKGYYSVYSYKVCTRSCSKCAAGTYPANSGGGYVSSAAVKCVGCPGGKVCNGSNPPTTCGAGTYKSGNSCPACTAGHYCQSGNRYACPAGQYQNATGQSSCKTCSSVGYGKYTSSTGSTSCSNCTGSNQYTNAARTACHSCGGGSIANSSHTGCTACPAGKYESSPGVCSTCPSGHWSTAGKTSCTACPTGATHNSSHTGCVVNAGYYLVGSQNANSQSDVKPCEAGYRCTGGVRYACSGGYYQPSGTQSGCLGKCAAGSYTLRNGSVSTSAATECKACPAGHACPGNGVRTACTGTRYQPSGSQTACKTCAAGSYTPNSTSCTRCQAGYYCPNGDTRGSCTAPKYSTGGATACSTCGAGRYMTKSSSLGTGCHACPVGQYQDAANQTACKACPSGKYQGSTGQTSCATCAAGRYVTNNAGSVVTSGGTKCLSCPAGSRCPSTTAAPTKCAPGSYQDAAGQTSCKTCASLGTGYWTDATGATGCKTCTGADYFVNSERTTCTGCGTGSVPNPDRTGCQACPAGTAELTAGSCTPCAAGQYQNAAGQDVCKDCPAGTSSTADRTSCTVNPGWHLVGGRDPTQTADVAKCPVGHTCAGGANPKVACVDGAYQPAEGQTACKTCAATSYTRLANGTPVLSAATRCEACERGYECPGAGVRRVCSGAKYSVASAASCSTCASGSYTTQSAEAPEGNDVCTVCEAGHFCADGDVRQDCEGKFYSHAGAAACSECGVGHFVTEQAGVHTECTACAADTFQPAQGQTSCPACPAHTHSGPTADEVAGATTCSADPGYFVPTGGDPTVEVEACAPGHTCAGLWAQPVPCSFGWYQPLAAQTQCLDDCPAGKTLVLASGAATASGAVECRRCPAGHACPALETEPETCLEGTASPGGATPACTPCAPYYYAEHKTQAQCEYCEQEYAIYRPLNTAQRCTYCPAKQYFNGMQCKACVFTKTEPYYCQRRTDGNADVLYIRRSCGAGYVREDAFTCRKCNADETCAGGATSPKWQMEWKLDPATKSGQILIISTVAGGIVILVAVAFLALFVQRRLRPRRRNKDCRDFVNMIRV